MNISKITAVILSGGQGSRLGGVDKGLVPYNEMSLIEHTIARLKAQVGKVVISANRNISTYSKFNYPVYEDLQEEYMGPMAGIVSVWPFIKTRYLLICPVDTPFLPEDLVEKLSNQIGGHQVAYSICEERAHYLHALIDTEKTNIPQDLLDARKLSIKRWYETLDVIEACFTEKGSFKNLNRPEAF